MAPPSSASASTPSSSEDYKYSYTEFDEETKKNLKISIDEPKCNDEIDISGNYIIDASGNRMQDCFVKNNKTGKYIRDLSGNYIKNFYVQDPTTGEYVKDSDGEYLRTYYKRDPKTGGYLRDEKTGKYVIDLTKFNSELYNDKYKSYIDDVKKRRKNANEKNMKNLIGTDNINIKPEYKPFYQLNLLEIALELKNTMFSILDDILAGNMTLDIILKDNRLFYVGLTILIIAIILYIYDYAIDPTNATNAIVGENGLVEIRHIYEKRD